MYQSQRAPEIKFINEEGGGACDIDHQANPNPTNNAMPTGAFLGKQLPTAMKHR